MKLILRKFLYLLLKNIMYAPFGPFGERALHLRGEWALHLRGERALHYCLMNPPHYYCRARSPNAPKDGSILVIILWVIIILSILSLSLGNFIFGQIKFTNFFIRSTAAVPLAKAACYSAFYERKEDNTKEYDSEKELLKERSQTLQGGVSYKYYFEDEGSRININTVSKDTLEKLPGLDEDSAGAIINSNRRPFKIKEEILAVEGITKEKFTQFKDFITVCGNGKVNINTVSKEALFALGLENDLIGIIMRYRKESPGEDGNSGTDDDGVFFSTSDILSGLRSFEMLSLRQEQQLLSAMNSFTVKSEYFRVNISVKMAGMGKTGSNFSIVIKPGLKDDKIVFWSE